MPLIPKMAMTTKSQQTLAPSDHYLQHSWKYLDSDTFYIYIYILLTALWMSHTLKLLTHQRWQTHSSRPGRWGGLRCWRSTGPAAHSPCSPLPPSWASQTLHLPYIQSPKMMCVGSRSCRSERAVRQSTTAAGVRPAHTLHGHWGETRRRENVGLMLSWSKCEGYGNGRNEWCLSTKEHFMYSGGIFN